MIYSFQFSQSKYKRIPILLCFLGINQLQESIKRQRGIAFFQLFFCSEGKGEIIINHKKSIIHQGQGFLIYPDVPYSYHGLTSNWTIHNIGFTGSSCFEILKTLGMYESGVYYCSNQTVFQENVQKLLHLYSKKDINIQIEFSKACYSFLLDLSTCFNKINLSVSADDNITVNNIITYLEQNYDKTISLDDLAAHMQLSKEYMCTLFKKEMHHTIMQFLLIVRIGWARIFLEQYPEKKIIDIAKMCSFESPSYFGKKFKDAVGITPAKYRNIRGIQLQ